MSPTDNNKRIQKESFGEVLLRRERRRGVPPLLKVGQKSREGGDWWLNSLVNEGLFLALDKPGGAQTMKLGRIY